MSVQFVHIPLEFNYTCFQELENLQLELVSQRKGRNFDNFTMFFVKNKINNISHCLYDIIKQNYTINQQLNCLSLVIHFKPIKL